MQIQKNVFIMILLMFSIVGVKWGWTTQDAPLQFGVFQTPTNIRSAKGVIGSEFSAEDALFLASSNTAFVLYNTGGISTFLSLFERGEETILWETEAMNNLTSALVPRPILASGYLDVNAVLDILFCYSIDQG